MRNPYPLVTLLFCALTLPSLLPAQRILLIEKKGSAKTQKFFLGDEVRYRLKGEKAFRTGYIENLRTDTALIEFGPRYVSLDRIDAFQEDIRWTRAVGNSLVVFGLGWSFFAGLADLTGLGYDYSWSDAGVTLVSVGIGFPISRIRKRTIRFGKKKNLRIVDITPYPHQP